MSTPKLSAAQHVFLNELDTKFRAYVGGFGCVEPSTQVFTEHGLMRICDIRSPVRVLSWNEKSQIFQLSLSGGAYLKGKGSLYRVLTQHGEFVSTSQHQTFSSDCNYQRVESLSVDSYLSLFDSNQLDSSLECFLKSLPLGDENCLEKHVDCLGSYADAAHLYGLLLQSAKGIDLDSLQLFFGAHKSPLISDLVELLHKGDPRQPLLERIRHGLLSAHLSKSHLVPQLRRLALFLEDQILTLSSEHTSDYLQSQKQYLSKSARHHKEQLSSFACDSSSLSLSRAKVESVTHEGEGYYYDMQVLGTHNYITADGTIHHNSGKTFVGCLDLLIFMSKHPQITQGYFGISYPSIRDIFYPTFEEAAEMMGFTVDIKETNKEVSVFRDGAFYGKVICRSMEKPNTIVGFKIARALVDEIDVLPAEKAKNAWRKIISRLRLNVEGEVNGIGVTTTPEGFKFVYEQFAKKPSESYSMVQASTYENQEFLPPDYINSLMETYPANLINAYLKGEFVNLTSGSVYADYYDKHLNDSSEIWDGKEPVHIGMDFNVGRMCSVIHVYRDKQPHAVDELTDGYDTPDMIRMIKQRYWQETSDSVFRKTCEIHVYPDSSGKNRKSNQASTTDISLLKEAGFRVHYKSTNPAVKDRVNAMNSMFLNAQGERRCFINSRRCASYSEKLEQQVYKNGEPEKDGTEDINDAGGYFIAYRHPIKKPVSKIDIIF